MEQGKKIVKIAYEALDDKKGKDITILNIEKISTLADYFIIASGENDNQVQALADNVEEMLGKEGIVPKQIEGMNSKKWVLMDYADVIIHIFNKEDRLFYDLERIWRDGKQTTIEEIN